MNLLETSRRHSLMKGFRSSLSLLVIGALWVTSAVAQTHDLGESASALERADGSIDYRIAQQIEASLQEVGNDSRDRQVAVSEILIDAFEQARSPEGQGLLAGWMRRYASRQAVEPLSVWLLDEDLHRAECARSVLASIPGKESTAALRAALPNAQPTIQIGLCNALGQRADAQAVPDLAKLARSQAGILCRAAAIEALGMVASESAVEELGRLRDEAVKEDSEKEMASSAADALLSAAARLSDRGMRNQAERLFNEFLEDAEADHRLAALRGMAALDDRDSLIAAMEDPDPNIRSAALQWWLASLGSDEHGLAVGLLDKLPEGGQVLTMAWLGDQGDASVVTALERYWAPEANETTLRAAALGVLGRLGGRDALRVLLTHLEHADEGVRRAARSGLLQISSAGVDEELVSALEARAKQGDSEEACELIELLSIRRARIAHGALLSLVHHKDEDIQKAAIKALGRLTGSGELSALVALLNDSDLKDEQKSIGDAVTQSFRQITNPDERAAPLVALYSKAGPDLKVVLVNLLSSTGSEEALEIVRVAASSEPSSLRNAGIHSLARWPNADPIDDLFAIAKNEADNGHRVVALRGFVNMARQQPDASKRYAAALEIAQSAADKRLVLSGLGRSPSMESMALCESVLGDREVGVEAALACVQIGLRVWRQDTERVVTLMNALAKHEDEAVRQGAEGVLERIVP